MSTQSNEKSAIVTSTNNTDHAKNCMMKKIQGWIKYLGTPHTNSNLKYLCTDNDINALNSYTNTLSFKQACKYMETKSPDIYKSSLQEGCDDYILAKEMRVVINNMFNVLRMAKNNYDRLMYGDDVVVQTIVYTYDTMIKAYPYKNTDYSNEEVLKTLKKQYSLLKNMYETLYKNRKVLPTVFKHDPNLKHTFRMMFDKDTRTKFKERLIPQT